MPFIWLCQQNNVHLQLNYVKMTLKQFVQERYPDINTETYSRRQLKQFVLEWYNQPKVIEPEVVVMKQPDFTVEFINTDVIGQKIEEPKEQKKTKPIKKIRYKSTLSDKYRSYLGRANKRSMPFELTPQVFDNLLVMDCTYCGKSNANGIDRINPKLGYTIDNSTPCCTKCNMMKYIYSSNVFLEHVKSIYNHQQLEK